MKTNITPAPCHEVFTTPATFAAAAVPEVLFVAGATSGCGALVAGLGDIGKLYLGVQCNSNGSPSLQYVDTVLSTNRRYGLEIVYDRGLGLTRMYLDGVLHGQFTGTYVPSDGYASFGAGSHTNAASQPWNGLFHEGTLRYCTPRTLTTSAALSSAYTAKYAMDGGEVYSRTVL